MRDNTPITASAIGVVCALMLAGCTPKVADEANAPAERTEQSGEATTDSTIGQAPLVEITFEWEGAERTVSGAPDRSFCAAGPTDMFTSTDPLTDAGVSAGAAGGSQTSVMAWATDELAVSFQGAGAVMRTEAATGDTVWANDVSGDARVAPAEALAGGRVSQSDLAGFDAVPATVSFVMNCTQGGSE